MSRSTTNVYVQMLSTNDLQIITKRPPPTSYYDIYHINTDESKITFIYSAYIQFVILAILGRKRTRDNVILMDTLDHLRH